MLASSPPEALLRAIFLSGGPAPALREVAGTRTLRAERSTAQAVGKRRPRWPPFRSVRRQPRWPLDELPAMPEPLRCRACAGTTLACPEAPSTADRLPLVRHGGTGSCQEGPSSAPKPGASRPHARLPTGEGMGAAGGDGASAGLVDSGWARGAAVIVRWPHPLPLSAPQAPRRAIDLGAALPRQQPGPRGRRPVVVPDAATSQQKAKRAHGGALPVSRRPAQEAPEASQRVNRTPPKHPRQRSAQTRCLRPWVCVLPALSPAGRSGEVGGSLYRGRWPRARASQSLQSRSHRQQLSAQRGRTLAAGSLDGNGL